MLSLALYPTPFPNSLVVVLIAAVLALAASAALAATVAAGGIGTEKMQAAARRIRTGAAAFRQKEYGALLPVVLVLGMLVYAFLDSDPERMLARQWDAPFMALGFVAGACCSLVAGAIGVRVASYANVRAAQAARTSLGEALRFTFLGGGAAGLSVAGFALLGLAGVFLILVQEAGVPLPVALQMLVSLVFGAAVAAVSARVGGGIFAAAADLGAAQAGVLVAGIPAGDPRNPAHAIRDVACSVNGVAGAGAGIFGSLVSALLAAMLIGFTTDFAEAAILFPLFVAGFGIVASIAGIFAVRTNQGRSSVHGALKGGEFFASAVTLFAGFFFANRALPQPVWLPVFGALASGMVGGILIGAFTEFQTSDRYAPVRNLARMAGNGPAAVLIGGLATGSLSALPPFLLIGLIAAVAYVSAGLYGVAIAGVGMLATSGIAHAIGAFGSIADGAGRIAAVGQLPRQVCARTDALSAAGGTMSAVGRGCGVASAAFTTLVLIAVYGGAANVEEVDLLTPLTLAWLLLGGALPVVFGALTLRAAGSAAFSVAEEARCQFQKIKGLAEGLGEPDTERCAGRAAAAAVRGAMLPGFLALAFPIVVGALFGAEALGGMLVGALLSGTLPALAAASAGDAWGNAERLAGEGNISGEGSEPRRAVALAGLVASPFRSVGPSIAVLVQCMAIVSILAAGF